MDTVFNPLLLAGAFLAVSCLAMALVWARQRATQNAGIVDVAWTLLVGSLSLLACLLAPGWTLRRVLLGAALGLWALRLGGHLWQRVTREREDGRYAALRAQWGDRAQREFFWFFQLQAVAAVFFALPALIAGRHTAPAWHGLEYAAMLLWLLGWWGERTADRQLDAFRRDPGNRGRTCRAGLWRLSRHPNYFCEWLMWLAVALFAWPAPWGAVALLCPAAMLYLLLRVTGIPATEAHALRSRGEDYRAYQRTTSAFVPWPPRT